MIYYISKGFKGCQEAPRALRGFKESQGICEGVRRGSRSSGGPRVTQHSGSLTSRSAAFVLLRVSFGRHYLSNGPTLFV